VRWLATKPDIMLQTLLCDTALTGSSCMVGLRHADDRACLGLYDPGPRRLLDIPPSIRSGSPGGINSFTHVSPQGETRVPFARKIGSFSGQARSSMLGPVPGGVSLIV
jgi:hypothetical protein